MNGKDICNYENREERYPKLKTRWWNLHRAMFFILTQCSKPCSLNSHMQHRVNTGCCFDEKRVGQGSDSRKV